VNKLSDFLFKFENVLFLSDNSNYRYKLFNKFMNNFTKDNYFLQNADYTVVLFKSETIKVFDKDKVLYQSVNDFKFPNGFTVILPPAIKGSLYVDLIENFLNIANIVIWIDTPPYNTQETVDIVKKLHEKNPVAHPYQVMLCKLNIQTAYAATDCDSDDPIDEILTKKIDSYTPYYELNFQNFSKYDFCQFIELYDPINLSKTLYENQIKSIKKKIDNFLDEWYNYINEKSNLKKNGNKIPFFKKFYKDTDTIVDSTFLDLEDIVKYDKKYETIPVEKISSEWNKIFHNVFKKFLESFIKFLEDTFNYLLSDSDLEKIKNEILQYIKNETYKFENAIRSFNSRYITSELDYINKLETYIANYRININNLMSVNILEYTKKKLFELWEEKTNKNYISS